MVCPVWRYKKRNAQNVYSDYHDNYGLYILQENTSPMNGDLSPREKMKPSVIENHKKDERDRERASPRSDSSSASVKHNKEVGMIVRISFCFVFRSYVNLSF